MSQRVLIYYPPNNRSIAIETLCSALQESGREVIMLTLTSKGLIHEALEKKGIKTYSHFLERKNSSKYFIAQARYLLKFCKKHKIDTVWSHLQEGNIIGVMAQPFLKANLVAFRHHAESAFYAEFGEQMGMRRNRKEVFFDKLINRMAKLIVVPSSGVWYGMEKYEGCNMKKVRLIPYIYDFSAYQVPDAAKVQELRRQYDCNLLLIMVSRLVVSKQHQPVFEVLNKLVKEGLSIKMIVMDDGPLRGKLEKFIADQGLEKDIFMVGFKQDFVNYMSAADLLIHPSVTEASNNVVKEMGLMEKGVAVCKNVGDFNEYIIEGKNGWFLENGQLTESIEKMIRDAYANPEKIKLFGTTLRHDVFTHFSDSKANKQRLLQLFNEREPALS